MNWYGRGRRSLFSYEDSLPGSLSSCAIVIIVRRFAGVACVCALCVGSPGCGKFYCVMV